MTAHKTCNSCREDKPLTDFQRHAFAKDGHVHTCKLCRQQKADRKRGPRIPPPPPPAWEPSDGRPSHGWQSKAACRGEDLTMFFGADGERQPERDVREAMAKRVCDRCPVRTACLEDAMDNNDKVGVFGGMGPDERAEARRRWLGKRRRAAA